METKPIDSVCRNAEYGNAEYGNAENSLPNDLQVPSRRRKVLRQESCPSDSDVELEIASKKLTKPQGFSKPRRCSSDPISLSHRNWINSRSFDLVAGLQPRESRMRVISTEAGERGVGEIVPSDRLCERNDSHLGKQTSRVQQMVTERIRKNFPDVNPEDYMGPSVDEELCHQIVVELKTFGDNLCGGKPGKTASLLPSWLQNRILPFTLKLVEEYNKL